MRAELRRRPAAVQPEGEAARPAHEAGSASRATASLDRPRRSLTKPANDHLEHTMPAGPPACRTAQTDHPARGVWRRPTCWARRTSCARCDGVDLEHQPGSFLAIMGPSGSGKSTMLNILGCLDRPTAGRYFLGGEDVSRMSDDALSRKSAGDASGSSFNPTTSSPQLTVIENIQVPLFYRGHDLKALLRPMRGTGATGRPRRPAAPPPHPALGRPAAARGRSPGPWSTIR